MAKKITVDLELKYKEAVYNLNEFKKEYTKIEQENKKLKKSIAALKKQTAVKPELSEENNS